ncbi:MAG: serine/threonine-protein kinase, partial [Gemmatimonadota bacterium]
MTVPPASSDPTGPDRGADPLAAGAVIADRYEIVRRIGTGGMSTVYLARHREMDRPCALKVLHPRLSRDVEARDRFAREARNASRIHHPNVATVFDFGTTTDGLVYLVMEYVEGRTLGALLAERQTLPARRVAALAEQIAAGLSAAHELGIVHRDLKPDNVMITGAGRENVKLVDFGIAKALEGSTAQDVTSEGVVVGTPEYMAPEQLEGAEADSRTD